MYEEDSALVSPEWLEARLMDPAVRVVEVDVSPAAYTEGHIPGSVLWNIYHDLKDPDYRLRDADALQELIEASGIGPDTTVVFYGYGPTMGFWLLKYLRHRDARILDASRDRWHEEGRPWVTEQPTVARAVYPLPDPNPQLRVDRGTVERAIRDPRSVIIDVRTEAEYRGERFWPSGAPEEHGRAGHVPSAVNLPAVQLVDEEGRFRPRDELRQIFDELELRPEVELIPYCTIGNRAAIAWFALTYLLERDRVAVYDGSWAEWGHLPDTPVAAPTPLQASAT